MTRFLPSAASEFLLHYARDAQKRWSPEDLTEQEQFGRSQTANLDWLDWSTESAALQLLQASLVATADGLGGSHDAILVAGPIVELLDPEELFARAARSLRPEGRLVGIIPCLRDNSPESLLFGQIAASTFWPYYTAEELTEMLGEASFSVAPEVSRFVTVARFNQTVLKDELGFKGFREIFQRLETEGYDPMEVGWGELRFVASAHLSF
ncbi:MAG: hypothetical protein HYY23_02670 [Verrucomicrobia bacterium]|nr:hypothetical protein [Verrucomicrobiota bacterium]